MSIILLTRNLLNKHKTNVAKTPYGSPEMGWVEFYGRYIDNVECPSTDTVKDSVDTDNCCLRVREPDEENTQRRQKHTTNWKTEYNITMITKVLFERPWIHLYKVIRGKHWYM
jgi:hypothetical protein